MITENEIQERVNNNKLKIGSYYLNHSDHIRVAYFDITGKYLGDTISLNLQEPLPIIHNGSIPILPKIKKGKTYTLMKKMLSFFLTNSQTISILGPSLVGKTSLTNYLESGLPERYSRRFDHPATMGKSVKRIKLGNSKLKIYDMGGQKDFWTGWKDAIDNSDKSIFIFDGTANNHEEIAASLSLALQYRGNRNIPFLILVNKLDLLIDGYTNEFSRLENIIEYLDLENTINIWTLETSIYNGICYNYGNDQIETPLSKIIIDFLKLSI
jgi:ADP-ribosylation factor-like protein 8